MKLIEAFGSDEYTDAYSKLRNVLMAINPNTASSIKLVDFCNFFGSDDIDEFASWLVQEYDLEPEDI